MGLLVSDVSLLEHFNRVLQEQSRAHEASLRATERTLDATAKALETRLLAMNEFRAQIQSERNEYVRNDQFDIFTERLRTLEGKQSNFDGRLWVFGVILPVVLSVVGSLLVKWLLR